MIRKSAFHLAIRRMVHLGLPLVLMSCTFKKDFDEDGISSEEDCDDENEELGAIAEDQDCDGLLTAEDCDDNDPTANPVKDDADCDGLLEDDDCDDEDPNSTAIANDADCDGSLTEDDCDDTRDDVYPGAPEDWEDNRDQDCDGIADVANGSCSAEMTFFLGDGTWAWAEGCPHWSIEATYDFDPDEPPTLRSINLHLGGTEDSQFDCRIEIAQEQICGPGKYDIEDEAGSTRLVLLECSGLTPEEEGSFDLDWGMLTILSINTGDTGGNFHDQPLSLELIGQIYGESDLGAAFLGSFAISLTQLAESDEGEEGCAVVVE
jgi:hypothetical protein